MEVGWWKGGWTFERVVVVLGVRRLMRSLTWRIGGGSVRQYYGKDNLVRVVLRYVVNTNPCITAAVVCLLAFLFD